MVDDCVTVEPQNGEYAGQRILRLTGRMMFATPGDGQKFLEQILGQAAPTVILDLSGVISCDSSGVGELMQIHKAFKRENRRLALAATPLKVQKILEVARVLEYFKVFATVEEAEAALM